jgi:hypothetical protein
MLGHLAWRLLALDRRQQHGRASNAKDAADQSGQLDVGAPQSIALGRLRLRHLTAVAGQVAQLADWTRSVRSLWRSPVTSQTAHSLAIFHAGSAGSAPCNGFAQLPLRAYSPTRVARTAGATRPGTEATRVIDGGGPIGAIS